MDEVAVFAERDRRGVCAVRKIGVYPTTAAMGLGAGPVRSIELGAFAHALACGIDSWGDAKCEEIRSTKDWFVDDGFRSYLEVVRWDTLDSKCRPADDEVALIRAAPSSGLSRWGGLCVKLKPGRYADPASMHLTDLDKPGYEGRDGIERRRREGAMLTSRTPLTVSAGDKVRVHACKQKGFGGGCYGMRATGSQRAGGWLEPDWLIRSIEVDRACNLRPGGAVVYAGPSGRGACAEVSTGSYPSPVELALGGQAAQSIDVGDDVVATLCPQDNLRGDCFDLPGGTRAPVDDRDPGPAGTTAGGAIRSMQLRLREAPASAPP